MPRLLLLFLAASLAAWPALAAEHVVLVSIDGFAAYHLTNQELLLPNIRELIVEGAWASNSRTVFPSVTHPSHTTILTGVEPRVHGVLSNGMTDRRTGETFHPTNKDRTEIVRVPTLFDAAKKKGLATAAFFWPETKNDPSIDFNIPEVFTPQRKAEINAVPPQVLSELRKAGVPIDLYFDWYSSWRHAAADGILADAAAHAIRTRKPGLLAIHILITDQAQHNFGPHHYLASAALTQADETVGILRRAVREAGVADETTFVIAADHGFHSVSHQVNVRPAFARAGLLDKVDLSGYGWMMWVRPNESFDETADGTRVARVLDELLAHPNIVRAAGPGELHALGQPRWEETPLSLGHSVVIADADTYLVADSDSDSMERRRSDETHHSHGYLPEHPRLRTALVLSGAGVRNGVVLGETSNLDIAPTIAELLGLKMEEASGRVLSEALLQ